MIESIEGSNDWTAWRDNLANEMDKWTDMSGLTKRQKHLSVLWRSLSLKEEELMRVSLDLVLLKSLRQK
ncbi:hypothetical protein Ahy_B09g098400 isoform B [Arachis hypogaea]|uniref:Uncharacterized protein n=1 Tax=Arachis hypogaea TaxID=3818 RepID=A0A444XR51_ARAHY|nr:hypothetical protein Ahy_B09g098400 isoform B [Arachis hypogaea]